MSKESRDIRVTIGERLSSARRNKGMGQQEVIETANKNYGLDIKQATISSYEKGKTLAPVNVLSVLARIYNVSLDWLCNEEDIVNENPFKTYSDIIKLINPIAKYVEGFSVDKHEEVFEDDPFSHSIEYTVIDFNSTVMNFYLKELESMLKARRNGVVDDEIFELWSEKTLRKYNVPIGNWEYIYPDDSSPIGRLFLWKNDKIIDEIDWDL